MYIATKMVQWRRQHRHPAVIGRRYQPVGAFVSRDAHIVFSLSHNYFYHSIMISIDNISIFAPVTSVTT
jgi:hypothetical protein